MKTAGTRLHCLVGIGVWWGPWRMDAWVLNERVEPYPMGAERCDVRKKLGVLHLSVFTKSSRFV